MNKDTKRLECASLPQMWDIDQGRENAADRLTPAWIMGDPVRFNTNIPKGIVLATFKRTTGKYGNKRSGNHTVIFLSWDDVDGVKGMTVLEQMPGKGFKRRTIAFDDKEKYLNDAGKFNVVMIRKR